MIINPFKKESTRKKLLNFLPVLDSECEKLSEFFKKNVDLVEAGDELSQKFKIVKGTEVLVIKKENKEKLIKLFQEFKSHNSIALEWLEGIRPFLLEDAYAKNAHAICHNKLFEIIEKYQKMVSLYNKHKIVTLD